mgnify:CR=1 FL=1
MVRALARPLLATWFVYGGVESMLEPERRAERAAPVVDPLLKQAGVDEVTTTDLVKIHGAATVAAATVLAFSRTPRTAGLALTGLAALTVAAGRPFWLVDDEEERAAERDQFLKNLSLMGGAMLAASAGHSARHVARKKKAKAKAAQKKVDAKAKQVEAKTKKAGAQAKATKQKVIAFGRKRAA